MKLVCPHCAKVVEVADVLSGQTTNCPLCSGPFTVPLLPADRGGQAGSANAERESSGSSDVLRGNDTVSGGSDLLPGQNPVSSASESPRQFLDLRGEFNG